jgi:hypothetical protein
MTDDLEVLIHWEIGELEERLEGLKKELRSLMIDRNTAALRMVAMDSVGFAYPDRTISLEELDTKVEKIVAEVKSIRDQIGAWENLLKNFGHPDIQAQIRPMIRTVELQPRKE